MKSHSQEVLEASRPDEDAETCIRHCLSSLYADEKHDISDEVVNGLTYKELIDALLEAGSEISSLEDQLHMYTD